MTTQTVMPRDVRPGDKIEQMNPDLTVTAVTVVEVEKIRLANRTAYRFHFEGGRKPITMNPGHPLTVERTTA